MPKRIQRKRTKGWKMPDGAVYVGRPTKFGNPFVAEKDGQNAHDYWHTLSAPLAVQMFSKTIETGWNSIPAHKWPKRNGRLMIPSQWATVEDVRRELRGKGLGLLVPTRPAVSCRRIARDCKFINSETKRFESGGPE